MAEARYLVPTSLGCYALVSGRHGGRALQLLPWVLSEPCAPEWESLASQAAKVWKLDMHDAQARLSDSVRKGYLTVESSSRCLPSESFEQHLANLLASWSPQGRGILLDHRGLSLAVAGFDEGLTDALAALSAKLVGALSHEETTLSRVLGVEHALPCVLDVANKVPICFFSMRIGPQQITAVVVGKPRMKGPWFRDIVWLLWRRYGGQAS